MCSDMGPLCESLVQSSTRNLNPRKQLLPIQVSSVKHKRSLTHVELCRNRSR